MEEKKPIDKEYIISSLKGFDKNILRKTYITNSKLDSLTLKNLEDLENNTEKGKLVDSDVIKEVFQSVSKGKKMIASAITDKGVNTDATATFEVMADNIGKISAGSGKYPVCIKIKSQPKKTKYHEGDLLDLTGMIVIAVFSDESEQDITSQCETMPADGSVLNKDIKDIMITWTWLTLGNSYQVIQPISMQIPYQIRVKNNPDRMVYTAGESIDLTGMTIVVDYLNGEENDITSEITTTPSNGTTIYENVKSINIEWTYPKNGEVFTTSIDISVTRVLQSITISTPTKSEYNVGEMLDLSGISVIAHYTYGATEDVTQSAMFSPEDGSALSDAGSVTVTVSYTENEITATATTSVKVNETTRIVSWTNGTDAQIAAMLDAHYRGEINIYDYWKVGDEREINLSAMAKGVVGETHAAQTVTMVLINAGGKTLITPVNGESECAFVVGQKNCLCVKGYMNSSNTNAGGWENCKRRTWCNETYRNALPEEFSALFKQFNNVTASGTGTENTISTDYFAFASEKEVFGNVTYANDVAEADNIQFDYYKTTANRIKRLGDGGAVTSWWARSPYFGYSTDFCAVTTKGAAYVNSASVNYSIAPFGCI